MKRFAILSALALIFAAPVMFAQDRGELGVFADMTRLDKAGPTNFFGIGGRLAVNASEHVAVEGEVNYDFERNVTTELDPFAGGFTTLERTRLRLLTGLFGPKFQTGTGALRAFVTVKGGFLNFSVSGAAPFEGFRSAFGEVGSGDTNGVFYPGGGIEAFAGPFGIRLDVGDEIYFENGANHNLRITLGPHIRF